MTTICEILPLADPCEMRLAGASGFMPGAAAVVALEEQPTDASKPSAAKKGSGRTVIVWAVPLGGAGHLGGAV